MYSVLPLSCPSPSSPSLSSCRSWHVHGHCLRQARHSQAPSTGILLRPSSTCAHVVTSQGSWLSCGHIRVSCLEAGRDSGTVDQVNPVHPPDTPARLSIHQCIQEDTSPIVFLFWSRGRNATYLVPCPLRTKFHSSSGTIEHPVGQAASMEGGKNPFGSRLVQGRSKYGNLQQIPLNQTDVLFITFLSSLVFRSSL